MTTGSELTDTLEEEQLIYESDNPPERPRRALKLTWRDPRNLESPFAILAQEESNLSVADLTVMEMAIDANMTLKNYQQATTGPDHDTWVSSMKREFKAHMCNKTWDLVPCPEYVPAGIKSSQFEHNGKTIYVIRGVWRFCVKTGLNEDKDRFSNSSG